MLTLVLWKLSIFDYTVLWSVDGSLPQVYIQDPQLTVTVKDIQFVRLLEQKLQVHSLQVHCLQVHRLHPLLHWSHSLN